MADTDKKFLDEDGVSQFAEETKNYVDNKFLQLDDKYIRSDDTTIIRLRNQNEINLQEDHNNAWFGYRDGKVNNWKFGDGTEGGLADVYVKDLYLGDEKLSETYIRVDDTTIVKLVNDNEINLQEDHNNAWFGYRGGKVTNWKFGDGTEGGLADVYVKDLYLGDEKLSDLLGAKANDDDVVHKTGNERISGDKTFNSLITKSTNLERGSIPATDIREDPIFISVDKNNRRTLAFYNYYFSSGYGRTVLYAYNQNTTDFDNIGLAFTFDNKNNKSIHPVATDAYDLGTSVSKWKNVNTVLLNGKVPAYDADVVHKSGDEAISGDKTFTSSVKLKSNTIDNTVTPTTNLFKNLYVTDKNDVALSSLYYAQRTTNNREFNLQVSHPNSNDILNLNLVHNGSRRSVVFQGDDFVSNLINSNLGTSTKKWKTINGINPGALSLPSMSYIQLDTSSFDVTSTTIGTFTPTVDGWAILSMSQKNKHFGIWILMGSYRLTFHSVKHNEYMIFALVPVRANVNMTIYCTDSDIDSTRVVDWVRLFPCIGNV